MNDEWRASAACAGLGPAMFYDPDPAHITRAKAVCASCRVIADCRSDAFERGEPFGVWGGLSEPERVGVTPRPRIGRRAELSDDDLSDLFAGADPASPAIEVLTIGAELSRSTAYEYIARAEALGLVERRAGGRYPVRRA